MPEIIRDDNNCIVKAFENNPIAIITEEINNKKTYWFKASDIGKALKLSNIRVSIQNYDDDEKGVRKAYTIQGEQDNIFLSSQGVYRVLYNSKKPEAKKFRKWAGNILDDIIFNEAQELKRQIEKKDQLLIDQKEQLQNKSNLLVEQKITFSQDIQQILLKSYNKKCIVYLIKITININGIITILYKFGNTDDIMRRLSDHTRDINKNCKIELIYCIESKNNVELENKLKEYLKTTTFRKDYIFKTHNNKDKKQTELIEIDDIKIIQNKLIKINTSFQEDIVMLKCKERILELENENLKLQLKNEHREIHYVDKEEQELLELLPENTIEEQLELLPENTIENKLEKNRELKNRKYREYYQKNKEKKKVYYEKNKEKIKEYLDKNKEKRKYIV